MLAVIIGALKIKYADDSPKARRELADAERSEIKVKQLRAELVSIDAARSSAANLVGALRKRCIDAASVVAEKITGQTDRNEIEIKLREHYAAIFEELRSDPNKFLNIQVDQPDGAESV